MIAPERPTNIIWDITYACPLRCVHCYSEAGRRPSRELSHDDKLRVVDAMIALRPGGITLAGGEPLLVRGILDIAARFVEAGIPVGISTGGWPRRSGAIAGTRLFTQVTVSVDGATAEVHDRIRGRVGSFDRAMAALADLIEAVGLLRSAGGAGPRVGIDCVVTRSNRHQVDDFCTRLAPTLPGLDFLTFGAVVPTGLANRGSFAEAELLTDEQAGWLASDSERLRLQSLVPPSTRVTVIDNWRLSMRPDLLARGAGFPVMQVEPDGAVRAMAIYEGTVGSLLNEPGGLLWSRAVARWADPFVTSALDGVVTMAQWARAARAIDYHFGSDAVRARIDRRPRFALSGNERS